MLRHFYYPLLVYRDIVFPFLVLSAIAVPCWLAYRLYRVRAARRRASLRRELWLLALVVYLAGLAAATLVPNHGSRARARATGIELRPDPASLTCTSPALPRGSSARSFCVRNAAGNFALFVPLGILLPFVVGRLRFWRGMQIAIALSVGIEIVQYLSRALGSYRMADVNDVLLNGLGACAGLALVFLLRWRPGANPAVSRA